MRNQASGRDKMTAGRDKMDSRQEEKVKQEGGRNDMQRYEESRND
jgi:hypothetical protein